MLNTYPIMKHWIFRTELLALVLLIAATGCGTSDDEAISSSATNTPAKEAKDPTSFSTKEADPKMMEVRTAIARGNEQALRDLLAATPSLATNIVHTGSGNITPLVYASTFWRTNIIDVLINAGADINGKDIAWLTPLRAALRSGQERIIAHLILRGVDLKAADSVKGSAPVLNEVIESGLSKELLVFLIDRGANVNGVDYNGQTPLHMAAKAKRTELMEILLASDAKPDARNKEGLTAAELAKRLASSNTKSSDSPPASGIPTETSSKNSQ